MCVRERAHSYTCTHTSKCIHTHTHTCAAFLAVSSRRACGLEARTELEVINMYTHTITLALPCRQFRQNGVSQAVAVLARCARQTTMRELQTAFDLELARSGRGIHTMALLWFLLLSAALGRGGRCRGASCGARCAGASCGGGCLDAKCGSHRRCRGASCGGVAGVSQVPDT